LLPAVALNLSEVSIPNGEYEIHLGSHYCSFSWWSKFKIRISNYIRLQRGKNFVKKYPIIEEELSVEGYYD